MRGKRPFGYLPEPSDIDTAGLDIDAATMDALLEIDTEAWRGEMAAIEEYLDEFGDRLPGALRDEHSQVVKALS